jgi:hypothetical protein
LANFGSLFPEPHYIYHHSSPAEQTVELSLW